MATKYDSKPATRRDLKIFATKKNLEIFATKKDLERFATKKDLERFATKKDLERFATKKDLKRFATKTDLEGFVTRAEFHIGLKAMKNEIITEVMDGFRLINEQLLADFRGAFLDRTQQLSDRSDNHEGRINKIETHLHLAA